MIENKLDNYPQILLLGNGINQSYGGVSWSDFLRAIATKEEIKDGTISIDDLKCPEPLKAILVTNDHVDVAMRDYCSKIACREQTIQEREIYHKLLTMGFDDILTTNYTYELEMAASNAKQISTKSIIEMMRHTDQVKRAERKYLLHTYNQVSVDGNVNRIWHIHGEARKPDSTVLGHYYYGNLLCAIKNCLLDRNYSDCREVKSWIDSFILGDIYVLGFGFGFAEIDLWWLLSRKAREKSNTGKVYFYNAKPVGFNEKHELMRLLKKNNGVDSLVEIIDCGYREKEVVENGQHKIVLDGDYKDFYNDAILDIASRIKKCK